LEASKSRPAEPTRSVIRRERYIDGLRKAGVPEK